MYILKWQFCINNAKINGKILFVHFRYWNKDSKALDFDGMMEDLGNAPEDSVIVLHSCAHNPTGIDPTQDQWAKIADLIESKKLFPFFDCAYQGFASGDLDKDAWSVRYFADQRKMELFCSQSFSKNFGLYNERAGNLTIVVADPSSIANMKSQITLNIRANYSNPPAHGCRIGTYLLTKLRNLKASKSTWHFELGTRIVREIESTFRKRKMKEIVPISSHYHIMNASLITFSSLTIFLYFQLIWY